MRILLDFSVGAVVLMTTWGLLVIAKALLGRAIAGKVGLGVGFALAALLLGRFINGYINPRT